MFELRKYFAIAAIAGSIFFAIGCASQDQSAMQEEIKPPATTTTTLPPIRPTKASDLEQHGWISISAGQLEHMKNTDSTLQIIDVRASWMYANKHIKGAEPMPLSYLADNLKELDKTRPIAVYDNEGEAGNKAADLLIQNGFKKVYNLAGGMSAGWEYEIEP
ncbi:MAG: rhodanese-like domain-containing protein [Candidatus Aquicultor sp.]